MFLLITRNPTKLNFIVGDVPTPIPTGTVEDGVSIINDKSDGMEWPSGTTRDLPCLGRSPENPKQYKVFNLIDDLEGARFQSVSGMFDVYASYEDYLDHRPTILVNA